MSVQASVDMSITGLHRAYAEGSLTPAQLFRDIRQRAVKYRQHNIWIHLLDEQEQQPWLDGLASRTLTDSPLWGVPFAIKDNIDLAGIPTTAGCEAFTHTPESSATVVQQLLDAGAIPVGKTNLDQFATGLNGTRSPWGACHNSFDPQYISGGSSSGSAVAVALGLASFSLGTDTAGSGRVPACFNNLVGLKPTRGLLSATGMLPACRSLDCISIFAYNADDANAVLARAEGEDAADGYSRPNHFDNSARRYGCREGVLRVGIIPAAQLQFFGDSDYQQAYALTLDRLTGLGFELIEIDYSPFNEAAQLLYEGPWVSERYLATKPLIDEQPEAMFPVVRDIISGGAAPAATELFQAQYRLQELQRVCHAQLQPLDCLLTPTAGRLFTIEEMLAEPVLRNSQLGYYTNFMNLLDMASVAVPTTLTTAGLPFGITLAGKAFSDRALLSIGNRIQQGLSLPMGATGLSQPALRSAAVQDLEHIEVVVCGAHMQGLPLNWQLIERGAVFRERTSTAACYRMYALTGGPPYRPGLVMDADHGAEIEVEIWAVPAAEFGSFVAGIPAPLGIGKLALADGRELSGFICEPRGVAGAREITGLAGWRAYRPDDRE
jgi:allophanate hydrolase